MRHRRRLTKQERELQDELAYIHMLWADDRLRLHGNYLRITYLAEKLAEEKARNAPLAEALANAEHSRKLIERIAEAERVIREHGTLAEWPNNNPMK